MRNVLVTILLLGLLSLPLLAQDEYPKAQVFGGYQYLRLNNVGGSGVDLSTNGWNASLTGNFTKHLGLAADFGGAYKTETADFFGGGSASATLHIYTYSFGPVISSDSGGKINLFGHALFGGAHASVSGCATLDGPNASSCGSLASENGFSMIFGGGVDVKATKAIAVRLGQFDWVYYRFSGEGFSNNFRLSTGIVFNF